MTESNKKEAGDGGERERERYDDVENERLEGIKRTMGGKRMREEGEWRKESRNVKTCGEMTDEGAEAGKIH